MTLYPFHVSKQTLREVAQSLQEGKKMARSLENLAGSLSVLASDPRFKEDFDHIEAVATDCATRLNNMYKAIAREALSE